MKTSLTKDFLFPEIKEELGEIYTKPEVVSSMLDLCDYKPSEPLEKYRLLEPSFGRGDFLFPIVDRLFSRLSQIEEVEVEDLINCIRAVEINSAVYEKTLKDLIDKLKSFGLDTASSECLASKWLVLGDFLLTEFDIDFTHVVGNPPYIRQDKINKSALVLYRDKFSTLYDRADIYVPFFEHSLNKMSTGGKHVFICTDRWVKNKYGSKLRDLIYKDYGLESVISMYDSDVFHKKVSTYPAITLISSGDNKNNTSVYVWRKGDVLDSSLIRNLKEKKEENGVKLFKNAITAKGPWYLDDVSQHKIVRQIEKDFFLPEEDGIKIGIGIASGRDSIYIGSGKDFDVESDRKLPLAMRGDIVDGNVLSSDSVLINPYDLENNLVDLDKYPKLKKYFVSHKEELLKRSVAKKTPARWYKTIDRVIPGLLERNKIYVPDIMMSANIAIDYGKTYPHHNLYWITSDTWDLESLVTILRSNITQLLISSYSTKIRGGYLRFQAQHLRRLRLPKWDSLTDKDKETLRSLSTASHAEINAFVVNELYGLDQEDVRMILKEKSLCH